MDESEKDSENMIWDKVCDPDDRQLYTLIEELANIKHKQRETEESLLKVLNKPAYRQWMHERILDQHKHERILVDIVTLYLGQTMRINSGLEEVRLKGSMTGELMQRLEDVENNIQFIIMLMQPIGDFKLYKMLQVLLCDEYIYQNRLMRMLIEK